MSGPEADAYAAAATLGALRRVAARRLAEAGIVPAALDARLLVAEALGLSATELVAEEWRPVGIAEREKVATVVARRVAGAPVGRILGRREFWGLDFGLGPDTLEPRPDTETLVEAALARIDSGPGRTAPLRLADLGTGSGAILVALLSELPDAIGLGVDRSEGAARIAAANARRNGVGSRAFFICGDWTEALGGSFDYILSNPPYIRSDEIAALPREVREHDPAAALDGGSDGFAPYRRIIPTLDRLLAPEGVAFFEIGADQAEGLRRIAGGLGFTAAVRRDLAGHDRVVVLQRGRNLAAD
ncbi:peptide chain release factor N(5)-glutamine methyltransferase [Prosthecomicrobium pneumaticum]|uniref:Release factor glutamine methyltransferase n=1 Tax=Prosthecomicrobium pneumaticum TaxID=81895 RepID=A0A7W9CV64_9HYPH|nr:peptide chain release factor N(5)-glutamine methyltransferase [Prosthecomicrobium pneumaticum]MBB5752495.1 release factor glutamine methyltransferase [Prosthecomicrobium pneumaticum]